MFAIKRVLQHRLVKHQASLIYFMVRLVRIRCLLFQLLKSEKGIESEWILICLSFIGKSSRL